MALSDTLDIIVIVIFIVKTQTDDGFSLGQAFWMTLCSTIAALTTNLTLILDFWKTSGIERDSKRMKLYFDQETPVDFPF